MNEKDFNQVIMAFFQNDDVQAYAPMFAEFKKVKRDINLQDVLNEMVNLGFLERGKSMNYVRTQKLRDLLNDLPFSYAGNPYSFYLALNHDDLRKRKKVTKPPTNAQKIIRDILIGLLVTIVGGIVLWLITR